MTPTAWISKAILCNRSHRVRHAAKWLTALPLCLQAIPPVHADELASVTPEQAYQLALEARTVGDYPAMLSLLRRAGKSGDIDAQEMLGSVLLIGSTLYGNAIQANPCEAAHWIRRAAARGSFVAWHQNRVLNNLRDLPEQRHACSATRPD